MDMHSGTFNPQDFAWQGLTLTPAAAIHIRELVAKQPALRREANGLRGLWLCARQC